MIPIFTFVLALAISFAILMFASRNPATSKSMQQRLAEIAQPVHTHREADAEAALEQSQTRDYATRLGKYLQNYEFSKNLQTLLIHANSSMNVGTVVIASTGIALCCAVVSFIFLHKVLVAALTLLPGAAILYFFLRFKRSSRVTAFNDALPDAIDTLSRALRAGHSIGAAMEILAEQSPEPLGGEFVQVFQQQKFGVRFRDALLQMGDRVPSRDLHFLITAILVQKETGGDLTEILDRTAYVIRDRVRIEGEVRTHTAQGRLTGWILSALPIVMLVLINFVSPGYSTMLFHDPTGQKLLCGGACMIVVGSLIIRRIVDVQV